METDSCKTYFSVSYDIDVKRNAELLIERRDCAPEELGIYNKAEAEEFIKKVFGLQPQWRRHHFVIGENKEYNIDVNEMIRITLKNLIGREEQIRRLQQEFSVTTELIIAPYIAADSDKPHQYLSLERDIIEFLYKSNTAVDLDYYVI